MKRMTVGAIKNRHDLPVDEYIIDFIEDPSDLFHIAHLVAKKLDKEQPDELNLYITGLTSVIAVITRYCFLKKIPLTLLHYDVVSETFYPQIIFTKEELTDLN